MESAILCQLPAPVPGASVRALSEVHYLLRCKVAPPTAAHCRNSRIVILRDAIADHDVYMLHCSYDRQ
jgi:hypothetical protein